MIFSIVSTYEKYSEIDVESMLNPQTNKQEPMVLELYQKKVNHGNLITQYISKPTAVYVSTETKESIPIAMWTEEMEQFYQENYPAHPVPNRGLRMGWGLKFTFFVLLALVAVIAYKSIGNKSDMSEFTKLPVVGNEYKLWLPVVNLDADGNVVSQGIEATWCKVLKTNDADSTLTVGVLEPFGKDKAIPSDYQDVIEPDDTMLLKFQVKENHRVEFYFVRNLSLAPISLHYLGNIDDVKR